MDSLLWRKVVSLVRRQVVNLTGFSSTIIDTRIVYEYALKANASGIIVAHNHPSNNPAPSESDVEITRKLIEAGKVLNITALDHLVICGDGSYYSFSDEGRM